MPYIRKISGHTNSDKVFNDVYRILNTLDGSVTIINSGGVAFPKVLYNSSNTPTIDCDNSSGIINFPIPSTLAFGDQSTNGSMRIVVSTSGISFEKRSSGSWVEMGAYF